MKEVSVMDHYFDLCLKEARIAYENGDVPVGAVVVCDGKVISYAHNTRQIDHNIIAHAEINAILLAEKVLNRWNLTDCDLYVCLEPCSMCYEVIKQARIRNVYYLLSKLEYKKEYNKTNFQLINENKRVQMYSKMISDFFLLKR